MSPMPKNQPPGGPNRSPLGPGRRPPIPGKTAGFWILLALLVFIAFQIMVTEKGTIHEISFSAFKEQVEDGNIHTLKKTGLEVEGELKESTPISLEGGSIQTVERFKVILMSDMDEFADWVLEHNPGAQLKGELQKINWFSTILTY